VLGRDLERPLARYQALDRASEQYVRGEISLEEFETIEQQVRPDLDLVIERLARHEVDARIAAMAPVERVRTVFSFFFDRMSRKTIPPDVGTGAS